MAWLEFTTRDNDSFVLVNLNQIQYVALNKHGVTLEMENDSIEIVENYEETKHRIIEESSRG